MEGLERKGVLLDAAAQWILLGVVFLLPIFALPAVWLTLPLSKMALLSFGVMLALILWSVARLLEQRVTFPNSNIIWAGLLIILGTILSALLANDVLRSFVGFGFERDTVFALFTFVGVLAAVAVVFNKARALFRLQEAVLVSFLLLAFLQVVRLTFGADTVFPSIFSADPTANVLGSWNDLAVFSGLVLLGALSAFAFKKLSLWKRALLYVASVLALFLLMVVNLSSVWAVLAVISFVLAVYTFSDASYSADSNQFKASFPLMRLMPSIAVFAISVVFLIAGSTFGEQVSRVFNVAHVDVRPSWEGTIEVGGSVYQENLLFGAGPNSFERAWSQFKPEGVNQTNFWNVDFTFGVGVIPTAFISGGLVVGILWLLFLAAYIHFGLKVIAQRIRDRKLHYLVVSSFIGALYLWILSIIYVPQVAMLALAFVLTGAAIAAGALAGTIRTRHMSAANGQVAGFGLIGVLLLILFVGIGTIAVEANRVFAANTLTRAVRAANDADYAKAQRLLSGLGSFGDRARFSVAEANLGLLQLRDILNEENPSDIEAQRQVFQVQLQRTISAARTAVEVEPHNYRNWLLLGNIYQQLDGLNIEGAYEEALRSYQEAAVRNPTNPSILIAEARLQLSREDTDGAKESINRALELKSNYTDAHFLLSQIEIREGNTRGAIETTRETALLAPNNPGLFFQLGVLEYSTGSFEEAVTAFERATELNPDYANALYFLGLSYDRLERNEDSLAVFSRVLTLNPENVEVAAIVGALETGGSAFDILGEAAIPVEEQESLPLTEEVSTPQAQ